MTKNIRESNGVKYWRTYSDANHTNRHAEVEGIRFCAFPYQSYLSQHIGAHRRSAHVSDVSTWRGERWSVRIIEPAPAGTRGDFYGDSNTIDFRFFDNGDAAFKWAAQEILK